MKLRSLVTLCGSPGCVALLRACHRGARTYERTHTGQRRAPHNTIAFPPSRISLARRRGRRGRRDRPADADAAPWIPEVVR